MHHTVIVATLCIYGHGSKGKGRLVDWFSGEVNEVDVFHGFG